MESILKLVLLLFVFSGAIFGETGAGKSTASEKADELKAQKEAEVSFDGFAAQVKNLKEAIKENKDSNIKKIVSGWTLPKPEETFKKAFGQKIGKQISARYEKYTADYLKAPAGLAKMLDDMGKTKNKYKCVSIGGESGRTPVGPFEEELVKVFSYLTTFYCCSPAGNKYSSYMRTGTLNNYFTVIDGKWRCLGNEGVLFLQDETVDTVKNQKPDLESFQRMVRALSSACKRDDKKEIKHLTSLWRIPNDIEYFRKYFGTVKGAKVAESYASCADKYTNYSQCEMSGAISVWAAYGVEKKFSKDTDWWISTMLKIEGKDKPIYTMMVMDANSNRNIWGPVYFLYIDGAFRFVGFWEYMGGVQGVQPVATKASVLE